MTIFNISKVAITRNSQIAFNGMSIAEAAREKEKKEKEELLNKGVDNLIALFQEGSVSSGGSPLRFQRLDNSFENTRYSYAQRPAKDFDVQLLQRLRVKLGEFLIDLEKKFKDPEYIKKLAANTWEGIQAEIKSDILKLGGMINKYQSEKDSTPPTPPETLYHSNGKTDGKGTVSFIPSEETIIQDAPYQQPPNKSFAEINEQTRRKNEESLLSNGVGSLKDFLKPASLESGASLLKIGKLVSEVGRHKDSYRDRPAVEYDVNFLERLRRELRDFRRNIEDGSKNNAYIRKLEENTLKDLQETIDTQIDSLAKMINKAKSAKASTPAKTDNTDLHEQNGNHYDVGDEDPEERKEPWAIEFDFQPAEKEPSTKFQSSPKFQPSHQIPSDNDQQQQVNPIQTVSAEEVKGHIDSILGYLKTCKLFGELNMDSPTAGKPEVISYNGIEELVQKDYYTIANNSLKKGNPDFVKYNLYIALFETIKDLDIPCNQKVPVLVKLADICDKLGDIHKRSGDELSRPGDEDKGNVELNFALNLYEHSNLIYKELGILPEIEPAKAAEVSEKLFDLYLHKLNNCKNEDKASWEKKILELPTIKELNAHRLKLIDEDYWLKTHGTAKPQ